MPWRDWFHWCIKFPPGSRSFLCLIPGVFKPYSLFLVFLNLIPGVFKTLFLVVTIKLVWSTSGPTIHPSGPCPAFLINHCSFIFKDMLINCTVWLKYIKNSASRNLFLWDRTMFWEHGHIRLCSFAMCHTHTWCVGRVKMLRERFHIQIYRVSQKKCLIVIFFRATRPYFLELIFQLILVKYEFGTPEKYSEDLEKFCVQADLVVNLGADKVTKEMRKVD